MILYHSITAYQLLNCIVHRIKYYSNEKAVLVLPDFITNKYPHYKELEEKKLFDEVYLFSYAVTYDLSTIEKDINTIYQKTLPYKIEEFREIYIGGVHFPFTIYVINHNVPFHYFEEAAGLLSRPEVIKRNVQEGFPKHAEIAEHYHLFSLNTTLVKSKIGNLAVQLSGYCDRKAVHFSVIDEFATLDKGIQGKIKEFYRCPTLIQTSSKKTALILTQHFNNLKILDFGQQILIYQLLVDYFLSDYFLVFKVHPDDCIYYDYLFSDVHVIREKFPSEFLPFIFDKSPEVLATISSTAVHNISYYYGKNIFLDVIFEQNYYVIHSYYMALKCFEKVFSSIVLMNQGCQPFLLKMLHEYTLPDSDLTIVPEKCEAVNSIIVDMNNIDYGSCSDRLIDMLDTMKSNQVVCFINCNQDFGFYNIYRKDLWNNIVPVTINKSVKKGEDYYSDSNSETMYFYTKNKEIQGMIENFEEHKELKYSGITLDIKPLSENEKKVKILEGILDATEKRLLFYIKREKELREYIAAHDIKPLEENA